MLILINISYIDLASVEFCFIFREFYRKIINSLKIILHFMCKKIFKSRITIILKEVRKNKESNPHF